MTGPNIRRVGEWSVCVQEQHDLSLPWKASATCITSSEFASGVDMENSLENLAHKLGLPPDTLLTAFATPGKATP